MSYVDFPEHFPRKTVVSHPIITIDERIGGTISTDEEEHERGLWLPAGRYRCTLDWGDAGFWKG
jgi:hypothetical protein